MGSAGLPRMGLYIIVVFAALGLLGLSQIGSVNATPTFAYNFKLGVTGVKGTDNSHFNSTQGLGIDFADDIFIADSGNQRVQEYDPNHNYVTTFGETGITGTDNSHFNNPTAVSTGDCGTFVADTNNQRVQEFTEGTATFGETGVTGTDNSHFNTPKGVVGDPYFCGFYVADTANQRIQAFNSSQLYSYTIGVTGVTGSDNSHLNNPTGLALDSLGNIYIADTGNNRVQIFNSSGVYNSTIGTGTPGTDNAHLKGPTGVAIDLQGNIYIADTGNHRVQIFNSTHAYNSTIGVTGVSGSDNSHFNSPKGVTIDSSNTLYVSDTGNQRIQIFKPQATPPSISITNITNLSPRWGIDTVSASGTTTGATGSDSILIKWGDGTTNTTSATSNWGPINHKYSVSAVGPNTLNATLLDAEIVPIATSNNTVINVQKHATFLSLNSFDDIVAGTGISAVGNLTDTDTSVGIDGKQITFSGTGATGVLLPVNSQGISITDPSSMTIDSCPVPTCTPTTGSSINILHLHTGSSISFPPGTVGLTFTLQEMGTNGFQVRVVNNNNVASVYTGSAAGPDITVFSPPSDSAGISHVDVLSITGADPGLLGISEIKTANPGGDPTTIYDASFDSIAAGSYPMIEALQGAYSSTGLTTGSVASGLQVQAQFAGDSAYMPSSSLIQTYSTITPSFGVGGTESSGVVTSTATPLTSVLCSINDPSTARDGLCDSWKSVGVPYTVDTTTFHYPLPGLPSKNHKNIYLEVAAMSGVWSSTYQNAINDVVNAYAKAPLTKAAKIQQQNPDGTNGIALHVFVDDTTVPLVKALTVWTDTDSNPANDYFSIKANHFGSTSERPTIGGTQTYGAFSAVDANTVTMTVNSGLTVSTPTLVTKGDNLNSVAQGVVTISQTLTFDNPVTITTPIAAPVQSGQSGGISWGPITATVTSGAGTTKQTIVISIPFKTTGPVTSANIGSIATTLSFANSVTAKILSATGVNSPSVTDTLLQAKAQAFRFALISDCIVSCGLGTNPSGISEQVGSPKAGNDEIIGLGPDSGFVLSRNNIAGTFMHELGHIMGLQHGGPQYTYLGSVKTLVPDSSQNCKPNYESVMSYTRQLNTYLGANWVLNYSSGTFSASPLTETALVESTGLVGDPSILKTPPVIVYGYSSGGIFIGTTANTVNLGQVNPGIDWDKSGTVSGTVSAPIQDHGLTGCNAPTALATPIKDYNDWINFNYNFTSSGSFNGIEPNPISEAELTQGIFTQESVQVPLQVQKKTLAQDVKDLELEITDKNTIRKLDEASSDISESAANKLWNNDKMTLDTGNGRDVFNEEAESVNDLLNILHISIFADTALQDAAFTETTDLSPVSLKTLPASVVSSIKLIVTQLVTIDGNLATSQIAAANAHLAYLQAHHAASSKITIVKQDIVNANKFLLKAQLDSATNFHKAILEYKQAWSYATAAILVS